MLDLVERLRSRRCFFQNGGIWLMGVSPDKDCQDAANEIIRLRTENARLRERRRHGEQGDLMTILNEQDLR